MISIEELTKKFFDNPQAKERYDLCQSCTSFNATIRICNQCGCFMPLKTFVPQATCPLNKWPKKTRLEQVFEIDVRGCRE